MEQSYHGDNHSAIQRKEGHLQLLSIAVILFFFWTAALQQANNFGRFWCPADAQCVAFGLVDVNLQLQRAIVRKLIDIASHVAHQNEINKQRFTFIICLDPSGG